jgi:tetratricopeptide (TPR) repeat protein
VGVILVIALVIGLRSGGKSARQKETAQEKYEDASEAFTSKSPSSPAGSSATPNSAAPTATVGTEAQETKIIQAAFDRYIKAVAEDDYDTAVDFFDTERIVKEIQATGMLADITRRDEVQIAAALKSVLSKNLRSSGDRLSYANIEVRKIKPLPDKTEMVAYVLTSRRYGEKLKQRLWVKKRGDQWRLYDIESLEDGSRMSTLYGVLLEATRPGNVQPWVTKGGHLQAASTALTFKDADGADEEIRELDGITLPPQLQLRVISIKTAIALLREKPDDALKLLDEAQAIQSDLPFISRQRAIAYNLKEQYDKALAAARKYLDLLGDDAKAWHAAGEALEGLGRPAEALDAYRKGHDDMPSYVENLTGIARLLTPDKKQELATRFAKTVKETLDKGETFATIATEIENGEMLEALVAAYRKGGGKGYGVNYHDARAKLLLGRYEEAHALLKPLVAKAPKEEQADVLGMLVEAAAGTGKWHEAYQTIPDATDAVQRIGKVLIEQNKSADLKTLADMHKKKAPEDGHAPYFLGKALMIDKDYAKAGDQFAAAIKLSKTAEERDRFREGFVAARYKGGKGLAAHTEADPQDKPEVFNQLADLMVADKDADGLAKLADAQRNAVGLSAGLTWAQARGLWLKSQHGPAADLLIASRDPIVKEDPRREKPVNDMIVRGLVRQKRFEDARRELARFAATADPLLPAMIPICSLDPAAAPKAVSEYIKDDPSGPALRRLYEDPDIGPALRSPDLFMVKLKYPEPPASQPTTRKV